ALCAAACPGPSTQGLAEVLDLAGVGNERLRTASRAVQHRSSGKQEQLVPWVVLRQEDEEVAVDHCILRTVRIERERPGPREIPHYARARLGVGDPGYELPVAW